MYSEANCFKKAETLACLDGYRSDTKRMDKHRPFEERWLRNWHDPKWALGGKCESKPLKWTHLKCFDSQTGQRKLKKREIKAHDKLWESVSYIKERPPTSTATTGREIALSCSKIEHNTSKLPSYSVSHPENHGSYFHLQHVIKSVKEYKKSKLNCIHAKNEAKIGKKSPKKLNPGEDGFEWVVGKIDLLPESSLGEPEADQLWSKTTGVIYDFDREKGLLFILTWAHGVVRVEEIKGKLFTYWVKGGFCLNLAPGDISSAEFKVIAAVIHKKYYQYLKDEAKNSDLCILVWQIDQSTKPFDDTNRRENFYSKIEKSLVNLRVCLSKNEYDEKMWEMRDVMDKNEHALGRIICCREAKGLECNNSSLTSVEDTTGRIIHKINTEDGDSGTPIWLKITSGWMLLGIHCLGNKVQKYNVGTFLNYKWRSWIQKEIDEIKRKGAIDANDIAWEIYIEKSLFLLGRLAWLKSSYDKVFKDAW